MPERSKSEEIVVEKEPGQVLENAVSAVEKKDAADPVISSEWMQEYKKELKESGKIAASLLSVGLIISAKIVWGILKFAVEAVKKKGEIGFGEGYKIGTETLENALDFEKKKEK